MNNHTVSRHENQAIQVHQTPPRRNGIVPSAFYPRRPLFSVKKPYSFKFFLREKTIAQLAITSNWICRDLAVAVFCPPFKQKKSRSFAALSK